MKNKTIGLFLILSSVLGSCEKDNDGSVQPDAKGYWRGYIGDVTRGALMAVVNRSDGSSRVYLALNIADTAATTGVDKMNGRWKMANGVFYGTYDASATSLPADTFLLQGVMQSSFVEMKGMYWYHGMVGAVPFRLLKQE